MPRLGGFSQVQPLGRNVEVEEPEVEPAAGFPVALELEL